MTDKVEYKTLNIFYMKRKISSFLIFDLSDAYFNHNLLLKSKITTKQTKFTQEIFLLISSFLRKKCLKFKYKSYKPLYEFIYVSNHDNQKKFLIFSKILMPHTPKQMLKFFIIHIKTKI